MEIRAHQRVGILRLPRRERIVGEDWRADDVLCDRTGIEHRCAASAVHRRVDGHCDRGQHGGDRRGAALGGIAAEQDVGVARPGHAGVRRERRQRDRLRWKRGRGRWCALAH